MRLGADPEVFLRDAAGALISSIGKIGGNKRYPRPLPLGDGFAVQEDNVALEYNIPPSPCEEMFVQNISSVMSYLRQEVSQYGLVFAQESAAIYPEEQLQHPQALEFGCDPDFNAWAEGKMNPRPKAEDWRLRSAGGHVHVETPSKKKKDIIQFIKHMDLFLGVKSVLIDKGEMRKQLYGKAGCFRPKVFGCEYRTLSNFWVFDDSLVRWVWNATERAMDAWQNNKIDIDSERDTILIAINGNNKDAAQELVHKYAL